MELEKLKARAYDIILAIENANRELQKINEEIVRLSTPRETPVSEEVKPVTDKE